MLNPALGDGKPLPDALGSTFQGYVAKIKAIYFLRAEDSSMLSPDVKTEIREK